MGSKKYQKNLIDIQTKEIWFEAKDNSKLSSYQMFTQLMHYVQNALNKGEYLPPFLCMIDTKKAAIMKSADLLPFLAKKTIKWETSASGYTPETLDAVSVNIGTYFVSFKIETHERNLSALLKMPSKAATSFLQKNKVFSRHIFRYINCFLNTASPSLLCRMVFISSEFDIGTLVSIIVLSSANSCTNLVASLVIPGSFILLPGSSAADTTLVIFA